MMPPLAACFVDLRC